MQLPYIARASWFSLYIKRNEKNGILVQILGFLERTQVLSYDPSETENKNQGHKATKLQAAYQLLLIRRTAENRQ